MEGWTVYLFFYLISMLGAVNLILSISLASKLKSRVVVKANK